MIFAQTESTNFNVVYYNIPQGKIPLRNVFAQLKLPLKIYFLLLLIFAAKYGIIIIL